MQWCTRSTRTAESACSHAHTLEGFALDDQRCFFGRNEALLDSLIDPGNQRRVLVTATGRVSATKGVLCGVDDGVFHQDKIGWLIVVMW